MTDAEYRRMTGKRLKGRRVRLLRPVRNHYLTVPAGTVAVIEGKFNGLSLKTEPCPTCGAGLFVQRVSHTAVELLPESDDA